jgi:hypothetical protein
MYYCCVKIAPPDTNKPSETRNCKHCGPILHVQYGPYKQNGRKRFFWRCIQCQRKGRKVQYVKDPKKHQAKVKAWMASHPKRAKEIRRKTYENWRGNVRGQVLDHYGKGHPKCSCPGCHVKEDRFLVIDHSNGGGTKHRKALGRTGTRFYLWLVRNGFPNDYRILCHNCNFSYGLYGDCPHNTQKSANKGMRYSDPHGKYES